ncbi:hypothetical protein HK099_006880 [Clydaea vesicula]|uniref:DUF3533 domain-containing protein n=1 Tax=Clydaea vesicula TaxID=447962 RepID=A0AAD5TXE7_9FUNG|nr:hypothetical protein HK099_006880 [Clydaea vesicula]
MTNKIETNYTIEFGSTNQETANAENFDTKQTDVDINNDFLQKNNISECTDLESNHKIANENRNLNTTFVYLLKKRLLAYCNIFIQALFSGFLTSFFVWAYIGMSWDIDTKALNVAVSMERMFKTIIKKCNKLMKNKKEFTNPVHVAIVNATFLQATPALFEVYSVATTSTHQSREHLIKDIESNKIWSAFWIPTAYGDNINEKTNVAKIEYIHSGAKQWNTDKAVTQGMKTFEAKWRIAVGNALMEKLNKENNSTTPLSNFFIDGPVGLEYTDLHPIDKEGQNFSSFIGPIVLWVAALFGVTISCKVKQHDSKFKEGVARVICVILITGVNAACVAIVPMILPGGQFIGDTRLMSWMWLFYIGLCFSSIISCLMCVFGKIFGKK